MNKKTQRNLAIIAIALTIISIWIANNQWQLDVQSTQASIDYWLDKRSNFYNLGDSTIAIYCKNGGEMDGDFNLILTFVNASFSTQTELPYLQVNDTLVKFRYILHKGDDTSKFVYFRIDKNVDGFSLMLTLEKNDQNPLKQNPRYPWYLQYAWNEQLENFELVE